MTDAEDLQPPIRLVCRALENDLLQRNRCGCQPEASLRILQSLIDEILLFVCHVHSVTCNVQS
jgi:hypothetical protein